MNPPQKPTDDLREAIETTIRFNINATLIHDDRINDLVVALEALIAREVVKELVKELEKMLEVPYQDAFYALQIRIEQLKSIGGGKPQFKPSPGYTVMDKVKVEIKLVDGDWQWLGKITKKNLALLCEFADLLSDKDD